MAIDYGSTTFGARNNSNTSGNGSKKDRPPAQFWLNFGYFVAEGTDEERFVSLPIGIPLDGMDAVKVVGDETNRQFCVARNDLLNQMLELASVLAPGDFHVIRTDGDLAIQIRRVKLEVAAPAADSSNPFARPKLFSIDKAAA